MNPYLRELEASLLNLRYLEHEPPIRDKDRGSMQKRLIARIEGRDWPAWATTMVGKLRLDDLAARIESAVGGNRKIWG